MKAWLAALQLRSLTASFMPSNSASRTRGLPGAGALELLPAGQLSSARPGAAARVGLGLTPWAQGFAATGEASVVSELKLGVNCLGVLEDGDSIISQGLLEMPGGGLAAPRLAPSLPLANPVGFRHLGGSAP